MGRFRKSSKKNANLCSAIVLEPCRETLPSKKYIKEIRRISKKFNCVLIFDEITSGWRINTGGAHQIFNVNPDIVVYGKTIANGIPMGAIVGKKKIMSNATETFISSSFWSERLGPSCALTFIRKHKKLKLGNKLNIIGKKIKNIWKKNAKKNKLDIEIFGIDPLASFKIKSNNWPVTITYFIQEMLKRKILASDRCYANLCHTNDQLKKYDNACDQIFKKIAEYESKCILHKKLDGPIKQMGFKRLTS